MATIPTAPGPDGFLSLLGLRLDDPQVQASLARFAHGMQPELDPSDDTAFFDWVTVNELGLEYGFMDEAHLRALDRSSRRQGPLVLRQLFFYAETDTMRQYPFPLPFGLTLLDDRATARRKLAQFESVRRSYVRDFWPLPEFQLAIAYGAKSGTIELVLCYLPYTPWPRNEAADRAAARFTLERIRALFGLRWASEPLRSALAPLDYESVLPGVRTDHRADFRHEYGFELTYDAARKIAAADQSAPDSLVVVGATFYAEREQDARQWAGELPAGLRFDDTPQQVRQKFGKQPAESNEETYGGAMIWHLPEFTINVQYSTLENRVLAISIYAPGFWSSTDAVGVA